MTSDQHARLVEGLLEMARRAALGTRWVEAGGHLSDAHHELLQRHAQLDPEQFNRLHEGYVQLRHRIDNACTAYILLSESLFPDRKKE